VGVSVQIEAGYGSETLQNSHPNGLHTSGKAVFAFWGGLNGFCMWRDGVGDWTRLKYVMAWYQQLEEFSPRPLCSICRAFVDCAWGDGGDPIEYHEDDYDVYKKRHPSTTEAEFLLYLQDSDQHWQPIDEVITGVQVLLNLFKSQSLEELEGFYDRQYTTPDFEALLANLEFLAKRHNHVVRLNFS
jgi:hypothetical protein